MFETTSKPAVIQAIAPARVNLLGEHTDYTGGLVLPLAIPFSTQAHIEPNEHPTYRFRTDLFPEVREFALDDRSSAIRQWSDYPVGVLRELQRKNIELPPFTLHLSGNVPFGAGLSSSASVEVASCLAMLTLAGRSLPEKEIALLCQRAENVYVGSPCGIMDQFVITAAKAGHALLLNTRDLSYELLPMNRGGLSEMRLIVCNSGVKHSVAGGEYGVRRRQLEEGQTVIRMQFPALRDLGDATMVEVEACASMMSPESFRRCRHVVTENERVRQARPAMFAGDPVALGQLMITAHASQRDDFECSCEEMDFLVDTAVALPGCFGARMTGGGFGGCTVNLVKREDSAAFMEALVKAYQERFHLTAQVYECEPVDGAILRSAELSGGYVPLAEEKA